MASGGEPGRSQGDRALLIPSSARHGLGGTGQIAESDESGFDAITVRPTWPASAVSRPYWISLISLFACHSINGASGCRIDYEAAPRLTNFMDVPAVRRQQAYVTSLRSGRSHTLRQPVNAGRLTCVAPWRLPSSPRAIQPRGDAGDLFEGFLEILGDLGSDRVGIARPINPRLLDP